MSATKHLMRASKCKMGALALATSCVITVTTAQPVTVPDDFPRFVVPGHEKEMECLRRLFWLHYQPAGPLIPLWDEWMPMSTLWPARGSDAVLECDAHPAGRRAGGRGMNAEGYIHTHQHDGLAHAEGWPFPLWTQAGGIGWHFRGTGVPGYDAPPATPEGWKLTGGARRRNQRRRAGTSS